jgi:hypothetical protein
MKTKELKPTYRENSYFCAESTYLFQTHFGDLKTKVHFEKGFWWTTEAPNYKATSVPCLKIK